MGWLNKTVASVWGAGQTLRNLPGRFVPRNEVNLDTLLARLFGMETKAGVKVGVEQVLQQSTAFACIAAISQGIGQIPVKILKEDEATDRKTVEKKHAVHKVLARRPNEWMTPGALRETLTMHALLCQGGFAFKNMVRGTLREMIPIEPGNIKVIRRGDWSLRYQITDPEGLVNFPEMGRGQIFHLTGLSWNGFRGVEILKIARDAIGLSIALEENHARLHSNGSQVGGILTTEKTLNDAQIKRLKEMWAARSAGLANAYKTAVLDHGLKFEKMAMSGVDAEHVKTRELQIQEVCRFFGVFPMIIGYADKTATFASAEAFFTAHVVHTLGPWVKRWEEAVNTQLLTEAEVDTGYYCKLFTAGLLRGDVRARGEFYKSGILTGWLTRNEPRRWEDLDPIEGLDEPLVPLNMGVGGTGAPANENDGTPGSSGFPNVAIAPKSAVDAMRQAYLGHNGGPPLDEKPIIGQPKNIGRVLSSKNERLIRDAADSIGQANGKLTEVLAELEEDDDEADDRARDRQPGQGPDPGAAGAPAAD